MFRFSDRTFICPKCGTIHDRDTHAAENMLWFARNNIGVGRTSKIEEIKNGIKNIFSENHSLSMNQEVANL